MKNFSFLLILLALPFSALSQRPELGGRRPDPEGSMRVRSNDTVPAFVRTWKMTEDLTVMEDYAMDTAQSGFQVSEPTFKNSITQAWLGSPGLQSRNNIYFNDDYRPKYFFLHPFSPYLYTPWNTVFYNITRPFTLLEYFASSGGRKEEREEAFRAVHTQNINPFLNFGFDIRLLGAGGMYDHQKSKMNNVSLFSSYTGKDYSFYTSFNLNNQSAEENGGLESDSLFIHSDADERTYPVNLSAAQSTMRDLNLLFNHRYQFGKMEEVPDTTSETGFRRLRERTTKTGSFIHTINFQRNHRKYQDNITDANRDFYPDYFISPDKTFDSSYFHSFSNMFQVMLDENPNRSNDFGARAFIEHDWQKYSHNIAPDSVFTGTDTIVQTQKNYQYQNVHIGASVLHTVGEGWDWLGRARYYLLGYKSGDLVLDGYITKMIPGKRGRSEISIAGDFSFEEPDHFMKYYESNNYRWNNDFRKIKDIRGSVSFSNEVLKLNAKFNMSLVTDLVYYDDNALPVQHGGVITVMAGELGKDFELGIFKSIHRVHYQLSSDNNAVRIPALSYFSSNFIGFTVVKNALKAEIGFDLYYYTKYRALAFAPSSGAFYNQDIREIGNYPYLNAFVNAKLKRTRFFIRYDHPHAGLIKKNYFHVLHYPTSGAHFRFGLSWTFYD